MASICVTGIWHQGAVLSACLSELGHSVAGVCANAEEAHRLELGEPPVAEPLLGSLLEAGVAAGLLRFTDDLADGLAGTEFVFLSTDTAVRTDDSPDTEPLFTLARAIGEAATGPFVLCVTAQVPVGTTERLAAVAGHRLEGYAYVPEFLRLGTAVESFRNADRVVVGADDTTVRDRVARLYEELGRPIVPTDVRTAELAKHAANAFLATSISFANEIADIAGAFGADPFAVGEILRLDRRIGPHAYLTPGPGFAGGTLGRELRTLQQLAKERGLETRVADAVLAVNDGRAGRILDRLREGLGELAGKRVALHGLTYKPGTPTLRRAASLELAEALDRAGASVRGYDPLATAGVEPLAVEIVRDAYAAAKDADAVAVLNPWPDGAVDMPRLRAAMRGNLLVDATGTIGRAPAAGAGFRYLSLWPEGRA
ncbi:MAG TPA: nucleotide sugar dehydrogenase [Gaiellaceae bacterium]|nr:nucleotide sugar dehydrogenase [Gaiellaceae bacterium]